MKAVKNVLVFVIMLTIVAGYANENCINVPSKSITILKFSNVKKGHKYSINDNKGYAIYSGTFKKDGTYSKKFDFSNLKDGLYTLEISKDFEIVIKPFEIKEHNVFFLEDKETKAFKPVVRIDNNTLMISQLNLDKTPLDVELFYNDELIYSDQLKGGKVLERVYKLPKEERGEYYVSLKSGDRYFYDRFKL